MCPLVVGTLNGPLPTAISPKIAPNREKEGNKMKVKLVGLMPLDFPSKDGSQIQGINLYCNYADDRVIGEKSDSKFISQSLCDQLGVSVKSLESLIGHELQLDVNFKGKVTDIFEVS